MEAGHSVSHWLRQVKDGDPQGAQYLWERYFGQMVGLARTRMKGVVFGHTGEEDIALSAFASFCRQAQNGRFPKLDDRHDLWRLLVTITARKAANVLRSERAAKRGGVNHRDDVALEEMVGQEPTPEFAAQCADELRVLLERLNDPQLARFALLKMEGYTNEEIAEQSDCAPRTVERKLQLIRSIWEDVQP